jgi:hypothetical protein
MTTLIPSLNSAKSGMRIPRSKSRPKDFSNQRNRNSRLGTPFSHEEMISIYGTSTVPKRCKSVMRNIAIVLNGRTVTTNTTIGWTSRKYTEEFPVAEKEASAT